MTDDERIARRYCEIMCLDPEVIVPHGAEPGSGGWTPAIALFSPLWTRIAREVKSRRAWHRALTEDEKETDQ